jgi:hypothetical protein
MGPMAVRWRALSRSSPLGSSGSSRSQAGRAARAPRGCDGMLALIARRRKNARSLQRAAARLPNA